MGTPGSFGPARPLADGPGRIRRHGPSPGTGERAYVYAKACGIIGKSFVGKGLTGLIQADRLSSLDRLIFPQGSRELPERELLPDLERRITGRAVSQILALVSSFSRPPELLRRLLRTWEYADLTASLNALVAGEPSFPSWTDLGPFRTVNFAAYPDLPAMLKGTEFEFLVGREMNLVRGGDLVRAQTELDKHYYYSLWQALKGLPRGDRVSAERILGEEISLRNCVWALRLRGYYGMSAGEVSERLMDIGGPAAEPSRRGGPRPAAGRPRPGTRQAPRSPSSPKRAALPREESLAADARASLDFSLDTRSAWEGWKRESFLNPEIPGQSWTADSRYFQNAAGEYLYKLALRSFHRRPFSIDTAFCFIRLKQYEEDLLTSVAEGLGLGMTSQDVFAFLAVDP